MERKSKFKTLLTILFVIGVVFSTLMIFPGDQRKWTVMGAQTVDDPSTGANSGICGVFWFEKGSTYTSNLTSGTEGYLGGGIAINGSNIDIPHDKDFDLIVWTRGNISDSELNLAYMAFNMSWAGNITFSETPDHVYKTGENASMMWANYVYDNDNSGYGIYRKQQNNLLENLTLKFFV